MTLPVRASAEEVAEYKQRRWDMRWDSHRRTLAFDLIAKVLVPMKPPHDLAKEEIRPLLIFWEALGPRDQAENHLFKMDNPTCDFPFDPPRSWPDVREFPALWIFSVSSYLRSIQDTSIELRMPNAARRLRDTKQVVLQHSGRLNVRRAKHRGDPQPLPRLASPMGIFVG